MDKTMENRATPPFDSYTLYPDAGELLPDVTLPTVTLPSEPTDAPPPVTTVSTTAYLPTPTPPPPPQCHRPVPRLTPMLRVGVVSFCTLTAVVVYSILSLRGGAWLVDSVGRLAAQAVFGTTSSVAFLDTDADTAPPTPGTTALSEETALPPALPIETAPPANEQPLSLPVTDILTRDLSSRAEQGLGLINETPYTPDLLALSETAPVIDRYPALESIYGKGCPAVLILHTHGTEAFQDQAEHGYHTKDKSKNILVVGEALAKTLTEAGIGVIQCTELFDGESFDMAYYNAARYIRETLAEHPSIRYILDIHRDAITNADGMGIRPITTLADGADTTLAQMMFVVGTDHGGSGHTTWETNLALACRLQSALHKACPTLMRDINLRSASFNAQYAPGALLIEAGAACSTRDEAIRSIHELGNALVTEILGE